MAYVMVTNVQSLCLNDQFVFFLTFITVWGGGVVEEF